VGNGPKRGSQIEGVRKEGGGVRRIIELKMEDIRKAVSLMMSLIILPRV
jgi:hypothetical protein